MPPPNYPILDDIPIPGEVVENWQITADLLAEITGIPAALIMRAHPHEIEVFVSSQTPENVYHPGERTPLDTGLYCETVMSTRHKLLVPNAYRDPQWDHNPDLKHGMISYCGLPLTWPNGIIFGTICILDDKENAYNEQTQQLMERFRDSLQFNLEQVFKSSATQKRLAESEKKLESNLLDSIGAIASTVEMRDPYTAGHQRRVSQLAVAIARKMQLPEEQVKGIHLASIVHDVGKIHIPSEILTRPGRLSDIEFNLIRKHPQAGHDILKGIQFPWPIAHIVLQHHERLDGSGYPQGLQGSSILLESRILAVADVVEAIASHRPYRPALGMDAAIAEISQFSGLKYDAQVVAACVSLFENGYSLVTPKEN